MIDIEENITTPEQSQQQSPMTSIHKMPRWFWWLLIVIVVSAVYTAAFQSWIKMRRANFKFDFPVNTMSPVNNDIEGWQTYRNEEYGFEFKYPEDWSVVREDPFQTNERSYSVTLSNVSRFSSLSDETLQNESFFDVSLLNSDPGLKDGKPANPNMLSAQEWFNQYFSSGFPAPLISKKEVMVVSYPAMRISLPEVGGERVHIYLLKGKDVYEIQYGLFAESFVPTYDQILSTFKFINPSTSSGNISMEGWKTYRNEDYGFEFKYPNLGDDTTFEEGKAYHNRVVIWGYVPLKGSKTQQKLTDFLVIIYKNEMGDTLDQWFAENIDYLNMLRENGNYQNVFIGDDIPALKFTSGPLPAEWLNVAGPISGETIFLNSSGEYVIGFAIGGQDHNLNEYGYDTNEKINALEDQILSTFKLIE